MTEEQNQNYYIWSIEHQAWWKQAWRGYTAYIAEAGVYDRLEANAILSDANLVRTEEVKIPVNQIGTFIGRGIEELDLYLIWNLIRQGWRNFQHYYADSLEAGLFKKESGEKILKRMNEVHTTEVLIPLISVVREENNGSEISTTG